MKHHDQHYKRRGDTYSAPPHLVSCRNFFPTLPQLGEVVQIISKLSKQYQILFQSGFNCSVLLQRVRFGVVGYVPTPQQGRKSLFNYPRSSYCFSQKSTGLYPALKHLASHPLIFKESQYREKHRLKRQTFHLKKKKKKESFTYSRQGASFIG